MQEDFKDPLYVEDKSVNKKSTLFKFSKQNVSRNSLEDRNSMASGKRFLLKKEVISNLILIVIVWILRL